MIELTAEQKIEIISELKKAITMLDDIADKVEVYVNTIEQSLTKENDPCH